MSIRENVLAEPGAEKGQPNQTPEELRATVPQHRSPLVLRSMEDFLAGVRYPMDAIYCDPEIRGPGVREHAGSGDGEGK